jgi:hypothetical protein
MSTARGYNVTNGGLEGPHEVGERGRESAKLPPGLVDPSLQVLADFQYGILNAEQVDDRGLPFVSWAAERYLRGGLEVHAHLTVYLSDNGELQTHYLSATLHRPTGRGDSFLQDFHVAMRHELDRRELAGVDRGHMECSVLVGIGHPEQVHQGVVLPGLVAPMTERLVSLDDFETCGGHPGGWCGLAGGISIYDVSLPLGGVVVDGELSVLAGIVSVCLNEVVDEVVETRSRVLNEIPDVESPANGGGGNATPVEDRPLILFYEFGGAGGETALLNERSRFGCDGIEVFVSPLKLEEVSGAVRVEGLAHVECQDGVPLESDVEEERQGADTGNPARRGRTSGNTDSDKGRGLP